MLVHYCSSRCVFKNYDINRYWWQEASGIGHFLPSLWSLELDWSSPDDSRLIFTGLSLSKWLSPGQLGYWVICTLSLGWSEQSRGEESVCRGDIWCGSDQGPLSVSWSRGQAADREIRNTRSNDNIGSRTNNLERDHKTFIISLAEQFFCQDNEQFY